MDLTDRLDWLQEAIKGKFPSMDSKVFKEDKYLHVWTLSGPGINFLPNFHLIFQSLKNDTFTMRLITYHGRTIDTKLFQCLDDQVPEQVVFMLTEYSKGLTLCLGYPKDTTVVDVNGNFVECFNDSVVIRSSRCKFKLSSSPGDQQQCEECQRLNDLKKEFFEGTNTTVLKVKLETPNIDVIKDEELVQDNEEEDADWQPFEEEYPPLDEEELPLQSVKRGRGRPRKIQYDEDGLEMSAIVRLPAGRGPGRPRKYEGDYPEYVKKPRKVRAKEVQKRSDYAQGFSGSCKICLKLYRSRVGLEEDMEKHAKSFDTVGNIDCPLCKTSVPKISVTAHFTKEHSTDDEPQTCCICCLEVIPNKDQNLRKHIVKKHQERSICDTCGKVVSNAFWLNVHVKTVHAETKDQFCHRCGKAFGHRIVLEKHLRESCGSDVWKCTLCPKEFDSRKKLRFHLMIHCEAKPYVCQHCAYRYILLEF
jgi:hypothetical protein